MQPAAIIAASLTGKCLSGFRFVSVWRCDVLTVTALTAAEYVLSSVALGMDEYYAGVGEAPGAWAGGWSKSLGLAGLVEADELRALVEGLHPVSGEALMSGSKPR